MAGLRQATPSQKHGQYFLFLPHVVLDIRVHEREEEGVGAKFDFFCAEERGFESESVCDTRATTDKNGPFLNMGFKHGKKWVDKNGAKCNMGFGRITENTQDENVFG